MQPHRLLPALRLIRRFGPVDAKRIVIIPASGHGSLGDQAMLDSAGQTLHNMGYRLSVIARGEDWIPIRFPAERIDVETKSFAGRFNALRRIVTAGAIVFNGADVIDGVYGGDCRRLELLDLAARSGVPASALGFSFSPTPGAKAVARLRNLPPMPMHSRDAISAERFSAAIGRPARVVADLAFLLQPEASTAAAQRAIAWVHKQKTLNRQVMALNLSGHTLSKTQGDALEQVAVAMRQWLSADPDRAVLLMPHDFRPAPTGDIAPLLALHEALKAGFAERINLPEVPFEAWDAKSIIAATDFALTGRMHLAIAGLGGGIPTLCIAYQGKFEGLMQHFELDDMLVSPDVMTDPAQLLQRLDTFAARLPELRQKIAAKLPSVLSKSRQNFAWLEKA